ncbi:MAG: SUMF1/EgtB/PvdO family nonheme iron enzyme [Polyangiaceae bacterium]
MLDPYPSAVVEVDTNLPVPLAAARLRVDVYAADGAWIESSDFARPDPRDWPVSFGVYTADGVSDSVYVRLRAYVEGETDDYRGERFRDWGAVFSHPGAASGPRLVKNGVDVTPATEPQPLAAVDRLVRVRLTAKKTGHVRVMLHGACVGTMIKLGERGLPDAKSESCVTTEKRREPLVELSDDGATIGPSSVGTWHGAPCAEGDSTAARACVPGGATVLGTRVSLVDSLAPEGGGVTPPVRIFGLDRFFIDREEVTVGQLRDAFAHGLTAATPDPLDGPLDPAGGKTCTWSTKPMDREALPVTCVDWLTARAYCKLHGGDLPTETQWEHVATIAGGTEKRLYPWGNEVLGCDRLVFARDPNGGITTSACVKQGDTPVPVTSGPGDVTPLGVHALFGGVREWTRDVFAPYESPCWAEASLDNPLCENVIGAGSHTHRGTSWLSPAAPVASRVASNEANRGRDIGFRCVYATREGE